MLIYYHGAYYHVYPLRLSEEYIPLPAYLIKKEKED